ncbi:uncharacterized protein V6R79_021543 [Siganus canaliculatus]
MEETCGRALNPPPSFGEHQIKCDGRVNMRSTGALWLCERALKTLLTPQNGSQRSALLCGQCLQSAAEPEVEKSAVQLKLESIDRIIVVQAKAAE